MSIRTLLIDDEPLALQLLQEYLQLHPELEIVGTASNGLEGWKKIQELHPDLIFLDIQMPKLTGFEVLEMLEQKPAVIFTTAYHEYALQAFEANALDYLLKPFSQERLDKAIQKYQQQINVVQSMPEHPVLPEQSERIVIKSAGKIRIFSLEEVFYLKAADDYVEVYTPEGMFLKNKTMSWFAQHLPPQQFVRVHRSYMVNLEQITRLEAYDKESHIAILKDQTRIPVSKNGYPLLKQALGI